ncbi:MAG TPA: vWA domain-containing protein [Polyangiaceae bacterium]|nr:vWA domain-containing protein [Polyangiaceae bacterium]
MTVRRLCGAGRYGVGAVAVLALAAACDSGSETDFEPVTAGTSGIALAGSSTAGSSTAGSSSGGSSSGGSGGSSLGGNGGGAGQANGGTSPDGGMGGVAAGGTSSGTGGGSSAGSGGSSAGSGGSGGSSAGSGGSSAGSGGSSGSSAGSGGSSAGAGGSGGSSAGSGGNAGSAGEAGSGGNAGASGNAGSGGWAGSAGASGMGGSAGTGGGGGTGGTGSCDGKALSWARHPSNVMLLMDRSGTMFDANNQPWAGVRDAVLPVIDAYDEAENVGFLSMTGEFASCPLFDEVAPAANNHAAISAKYNALVKPTKGESPFALALSRAKVLLEAAPAGEKFVILVIDGQPDYCDDGNPLCPIDSVVARVQLLKAAGITTLVAGLPLTVNAVGDANVYAAALQAYANAGVGQPTTIVGTSVSDVYFQCTGSTGWNTEFTASGKPAQQALGSYEALAGTASFTSLTPANGASLTSAFNQLFARTQSCTFTAAGGKVSLAATGTVKVGGNSVPNDATNGWQLKTETELELVGTACEALRAAPDVAVSIDLPCTAD